MTIASRKHKEREDMRSLILDAARKIFLVKGYYDTSMRNIAEEIQYSPGTIYLYFRDKDAIFHELHEEGFRRMLEKMQPLTHVSSPFEKLKAMGRVYLEFAFGNKDFYDLMFIMQAPIKHEAENEEWQMGNRTLNFLKSILTECKAEGYFKGKNVEYLSFAVWSCVHGMAALYCRERCRAYHNIEPKDLIEHGYKYFVNMLERL